MGASESRGLPSYEIYTLIGYLSSLYDSVSNNTTPANDAQSLILTHLHRLNRYSLDSSPGSNNRIFPDGSVFLEISERYRDSNGTHAWSLVLQFRPQAKIIKIMYGIPGQSQTHLPNPGPNQTPKLPPLSDANSTQYLQQRQASANRFPQKKHQGVPDGMIGGVQRNPNIAVPKQIPHPQQLSRQQVQAYQQNQVKNLPGGTQLPRSVQPGRESQDGVLAESRRAISMLDDISSYPAAPPVPVSSGGAGEASGQKDLLELNLNQYG